MCTVDGFLYFSLGSTSPTAQPPTSILRLSITHSSFAERGQQTIYFVQHLTVLKTNPPSTPSNHLSIIAPVSAS